MEKRQIMSECVELIQLVDGEKINWQQDENWSFIKEFPASEIIFVFLQ